MGRTRVKSWSINFKNELLVLEKEAGLKASSSSLRWISRFLKYSGSTSLTNLSRQKLSFCYITDLIDANSVLVKAEESTLTIPKSTFWLDPDPSAPIVTNYFLKIYFNIIILISFLFFYFRRNFPAKFYIHLLFPNPSYISNT